MSVWVKSFDIVPWVLCLCVGDLVGWGSYGVVLKLGFRVSGCAGIMGKSVQPGILTVAP